MKQYSYTGLFSADMPDRRFADGQPSFWQRHKGKILGAAALAGLGGLGYVYRDELGRAVNGTKEAVTNLSNASTAIQEWDGMVNALNERNSQDTFEAALRKGQAVAAMGNTLTAHQVGLCKGIMKKLESAYERLANMNGRIGGWWTTMKYEQDVKNLGLKFEQMAG